MRAHHLRMGLLATAIVFGVLLLGASGITGLVVSESCCVGEDCAAENVCTAIVQRPAADGAGAAAAGLLLVVVALGLVAGEITLERAHAHREYRERKQSFRDKFRIV